MGRAESSVRAAAAKSSSRRDSGVENSTMRPGELGSVVGLPEAVVAAAAQFGEALFEGVGDVEGWVSGFFLAFVDFFAARLVFGSGSISSAEITGPLHGLEPDVAALDGEERVDARAFWLREHARDDLVDGVATDDAAAVQAGDGAAACVEQTQVVVDLGGGGDGGAWVACLILLLDRDCRCEAIHVIDVGLLDALEELARVGRERLDVAALAFGVDGVEGEGGFAGAGDTADDCEGVVRDVDVDALEVVRARAADGDLRLLGEDLGGVDDWHELSLSAVLGAQHFDEQEAGADADG